MTNCNHIKKLIDEAEQPELLPFEAANHLNACAPCRLFADERSSLRALLIAMPRVNAPLNFDAQLKARMAEKKAMSAFLWLNPALYFRVGAVSAALLIAVFAAQYSGLVSLTNSTTPQTAATPAATAPTIQTPAQSADAGNPGADKVVVVPPQIVSPVSPALTGTQTAALSQPVTFSKPHRGHATRMVDEFSANAVPGLIVRDKRGHDVELPMMPVSVGAQSQLLRRAARSSAQPVVMQPVSF